VKSHSSTTTTDTPLAGDWIAQGHDGVGAVGTDFVFRLKNALINGDANNTFVYASPSDIPIAGHWQTTYAPVVNPPPILLKPTGTLQPPWATVPPAPTFIPATRAALVPHTDNVGQPVM